MNDFEKIKESTDLIQLSTRLGFTFKVGTNLCPFHKEQTPSCRIGKNDFHCFGCEAKGSVIDFYMNLNDLTESQAVKELLQILNLEKEIIPSDKTKEYNLKNNLVNYESDYENSQTLNGFDYSDIYQEF
ncbi:MAG: CHC2 zinc finger domain-containing protein, partial [Patescibacteria group bacterium]